MVFSERLNGVEIISFDDDRINANNVGSIKPVILKLFETPHTRAVIDLGGVNYLDSTAFAMFLHLLRVARSNYGIFRICGLTPRAAELFEMLQLHQALDIFPDREACLESFRRSGPS
ncbi:MAG: STAS domain-containing protein [Bacteroidales bacterium]